MPVNDYFKFLNVGKNDKFSKLMSLDSNDILRKVKLNKNKDVNEYENIESTVKNILGQIDVNDDSKLNNIFKDIQLPISEEKKYNIIDDLSNSLQLIKKIIKVYRNNILMTEGIKYNFLFYKPTEVGESAIEDCKHYIIKAKEIIDYYDYTNVLKKDIVDSLLSYGKYYVEIIDINNTKIEYDNYISEEKNKNINGEISKLKILNEKIHNRENFDASDYKLLTDNLISFGDEVDYTNDMELNNFFTEKHYYDSDTNDKDDFNFLFTEKKDTDNNDKTLYFKDKNKTKHFNSSLSNIIINKHKPSDIVEIKGQNENIFGYVQLSTIRSKNNNTNFNQNILSIINRLNNTVVNHRESENNSDIVLKNLTKVILQKTIKQYNIKIKNKKKSLSLSKHLENELIKKLEPEMFNNLRKMIISSNKDDILFNKLNVRFIFPSNMIVYDIGEGIVEKLIYPGKLYLLTQLSNIMMKISRAPLTRVWKIESGQRSNYRKIIDGFKRHLRNSRTSVDQLITTSSSKFLTDYKDHISLTYNGQESVTPTINSFGDTNIKMNDLEDLRREIISLSEVPSQLLGVSDGMELREHLVYTNINFATEIINIQEVINNGNNKFVNRISNILNGDDNKNNKDKMMLYVNVSLLPPVVLLLQLIEGSLSSIERIYQTFKSAEENISFKYLVETFCPYLDYVKLDQLGKADNIKKAAKLAQNNMDEFG